MCFNIFIKRAEFLSNFWKCLVSQFLGWDKSSCGKIPPALCTAPVQQVIGRMGHFTMCWPMKPQRNVSQPTARAWWQQGLHRATRQEGQCSPFLPLKVLLHEKGHEWLYILFVLENSFSPSTNEMPKIPTSSDWRKCKLLADSLLLITF